MKGGLWISILPVIIAFESYCQDLPAPSENAIEILAEKGENGDDDENSLHETLEYLKKNPIELNSCSEDELKETGLLTGLQIINYLSYRKFLGNLLSIYELQAIPGWNLETIRKLLPFIRLNKEDQLPSFKEQYQQSEKRFVFRISRLFEKSIPDSFLGGPQKIYLNYRCSYKKRWRFGFVAEKDAGEPFFKRSQRLGFDHYSFHFFLKNKGKIKSLAIGDFTINIGQGLIHWQSMSFKKSSNALGIKRQQAILLPYHSAGEYNYLRGAAITLSIRKIDGTFFISQRKLSANLLLDSNNNPYAVTSLLTSGYHRTRSENEERNKLVVSAAGMSLLYKLNSGEIGLNLVAQSFSIPIEKRNYPYNLYVSRGKLLYNGSVNYSSTYNNIHFFGEIARNQGSAIAFINGLMLSVDPAVDLAFLFRYLSPAYQALSGNAFTENTTPGNEIGYYIGMVLRPSHVLRLDGYFDIFSFPWLKYGADARTSGLDMLFQVTFNPNRQLEIMLRLKKERKEVNMPGWGGVMNRTGNMERSGCRSHISFQMSGDLLFRIRTEMTRVMRPDENRESGYLTFLDVLYKPPLQPFRITARWQYFETDGYDSRIYAYENDVPLNYGVPLFYGKGHRYYLITGLDLSKNVSVDFKMAFTRLFSKENDLQSLTSEFNGNRIEARMQLIWQL